MMSYIVFSQSTLILALLILYTRDRKRIKSQHNQILKLKKKKTDEANKTENIISNRRKNFRLPIHLDDCTLEFWEFENKQLERLKNKKINTTIENISAQGLKVVAEYNLPVKNSIIVNITFKLFEQEFSFKGEIVRKEEHRKENHIAYGVHFIEVNDQDEQQLIKTLNYVLTERKKKIS